MSADLPQTNDPPAATTPAADSRVSILVGDRLCTRCGYNLVGQGVWRETHYQMLIVRCPECGTVASVQEYPLLGRWAARWSTLLAGLWLIVLLGMFIATTMTIFGFAYAAADEADYTFREYISNHFQVWVRSDVGIDPEGPKFWQAQQQHWSTWRANQDMDALFAAAGGWRGGIRWHAAMLWIPMSLFSAGYALFWSVALLGLRWRGRAAFGLATLAAILLVTAIPMTTEWSNPTSMWTGASAYIGPRFMALSLVVAAAIWMPMLLLGRVITRGVVRALLPPRLRGALAGLWLADGLTPPTNGPRS